MNKVELRYGNSNAELLEVLFVDSEGVTAAAAILSDNFADYGKVAATWINGRIIPDWATITNPDVYWLTLKAQPRVMRLIVEGAPA